MQYNQLGIYELYKDQIECLYLVLQNEYKKNELGRSEYMECKNSYDKVNSRTSEMNSPLLKNSPYVENEYISTSDLEFLEISMMKEATMSIDELNVEELQCSMSVNKKNKREPESDKSNTINDFKSEYKNSSVHIKSESFIDEESKEIEEPHNFLFSLPTCMGKTLIYDILIIRSVLYKAHRIILALPTISLIDEKYMYYEKILGTNTVSLNIRKFNNTHFTGYSYNLASDIAICTYEQANIILNIIIKHKLKATFLFILDEIQILQDPNRGYSCETLITKIKYIQKNFPKDIIIKIFGFSATFTNIYQLAEWLEAKTYISQEKVQRIKFLYKMNNKLYRNLQTEETEREIQKSYPLDPEHLGLIITEELLLKRNVLVFCPSRNRAEKTANFLSNIIPYYFKEESCKNQELVNKRQELIRKLQEIQIKIKNFDKLIRSGIFFHHAQMQKLEKQYIEDAFRENTLFCLCCTTTLSVGLNLKVHTIIIRSLKIGVENLSKDQIIQIAGRCGRVKKNTTNVVDHKNYNDSKFYNKCDDSKYFMNTQNDTLYCIKDYDIGWDGKVVIFLNSKDKNRISKMMNENLENTILTTKLTQFNLCKFICECIYLELITTKGELFEFILNYSLKCFKVDNMYEVKMELRQLVQFLFENKLITIPIETERNYYNKLFEETYQLNLDIVESMFTYNFLIQRKSKEVLEHYNSTNKKELLDNLLLIYKNSHKIHNTFDSNQEQGSFFTYPSLILLLLSHRNNCNISTVENLYVEYIKYIFTSSCFNEERNTKKNSVYLCDWLEENDSLTCSDFSSYIHFFPSIVDFVFNYTLIQMAYLKGFIIEELFLIFVFCLNDASSIRIHFDLYEDMIMSNENIQKIFHFLGFQVQTLKKLHKKYEKPWNREFKDIIYGKVSIEEWIEEFEKHKIKRFYLSLLIYDLYSIENVYIVSSKYRLEPKEIKNLYIQCCYNLSCTHKILKNFNSTLDIICTVLEHFLQKMKSKNFVTIF